MLVQAALELGEATERNGMHSDAISTYDKVIQLARDGSVPNKPSMANATAKAQERLTALYQTVALNPSTVPYSLVQKVIATYFNNYTDAKARYGSSGSTALATLAELVSIYSRTTTEENQLNAVQALREAVVDIVSGEKSPSRLWESAKKLAAMYTSNGYVLPGTILLPL